MGRVGMLKIIATRVETFIYLDVIMIDIYTQIYVDLDYLDVSI